MAHLACLQQCTRPTPSLIAALSFNSRCLLVHATTPPVPLDRCVKAPTRARPQVIWQRWYCTIVLVLWAYAPAAYILTILLGYYRAFPAGVVVCTGMVIFDGINLPPRVWGPFSFVPYLSINRDTSSRPPIG